MPGLLERAEVRVEPRSSLWWGCRWSVLELEQGNRFEVRTEGGAKSGEGEARCRCKVKGKLRKCLTPGFCPKFKK